jgi:predicted transcriptional regulator
MPKKKSKLPAHTRSGNEVRAILLRYFYDRNANSTSARGKKGSAVKISGVKKELKAAHGLTQQEVQSNLTYLRSQGWVEEVAVEKSFTAPRGTVIPSTTTFYRITAAGIERSKEWESSQCRDTTESRSKLPARTSSP